MALAQLLPLISRGQAAAPIVVTGPPAAALAKIVVSAQQPEPLVGHDTVAAVIGALIAAIAGAAVQAVSSRRQEQAAERAFLKQEQAAERAHSREVQERDDRRRELEAAAAFSLINKANRAATTIARLHEVLHEGRVEALRRRCAQHGAIVPSASDDPLVIFSDAELSLIQRLCKGRLLNQALDLPHVQRMYVDFMRTYRDLRAQIPALMSANVINEDGFSTTSFDGVNGARAEILYSEMERQLSQMLVWSPYDRAYSHNVLHDLFLTMRNHYGEKALHIRLDISRMKELPDPRTSKFNPMLLRVRRPRPSAGLEPLPWRFV